MQFDSDSVLQIEFYVSLSSNDVIFFVKGLMTSGRQHGSIDGPATRTLLRVPSDSGTDVPGVVPWVRCADEPIVQSLPNSLHHHLLSIHHILDTEHRRHVSDHMYMYADVIR